MPLFIRMCRGVLSIYHWWYVLTLLMNLGQTQRRELRWPRAWVFLALHGCASGECYRTPGHQISCRSDTSSRPGMFPSDMTNTLFSHILISQSAITRVISQVSNRIWSPTKKSSYEFQSKLSETGRPLKEIVTLVLGLCTASAANHAHSMSIPFCTNSIIAAQPWLYSGGTCDRLLSWRRACEGARENPGARQEDGPCQRRIAARVCSWRNAWVFFLMRNLFHKFTNVSS